MGGARKGVLQTGAVVDDPTRVTSASRAWCRRPKGNDSTERSLAFIAQNVRGLSATKLECLFELMTQRCAYAAVITETKRCAESDAVEYPREQGTFLVFYHGLAANGKNRRSQGVAVVLSPEAASDWKCAESPPPVVMFGERIIALQLAARGLSRGHSKYKKVLLVGAYAPVSSAPEGERELFLRNLQAVVESTERDALLVVGGDFNAQLGVRQPDSLVGVRDTVRGPFGIPHVNRAGEALLDVLVSCELRAVLSYFEKRTRKDFFADNFDAAYGTWLHPGTKKPYTLDHWFVRQADFKYVTDAAVNSAGVPKTDHRLVRLDLVFKFLPRRLRAVKPRIDRTLLEDPVLKLKFQNSVADFIDAAQKGQYAALTTQFPSMVAHTLPPGHPGTEFAPAGVLDAALECAAKKHLEVVTSRRSPNWFEAHREALNKAIAFRNECSSQLFKRPKDAAVKAEFARARQVLRKAVRRARARFRVDLIRSLNCNPKHCPGQTFEVIRKLQSISSSHDSGSKKPVMLLKNPKSGALCKTRQENAEVYRDFAEELYSRTEATPIDQGIIDLLDQRPVNHLLAEEPDETELLRVLNNRKCGSAPGGDGKVVDFYKAMCAPLEGGSGRGLTKLLEVVRYIWRTEKVEESWLVGKLRVLPKSGDLSNPNNWRGITLLAVIAKLFCSVLSNRMTSHMQVIGLEAQCGFMPGKSTVDAIFTMRVSLQKRFRFQKDTWVLFVDFVKAFDTVPREMLFRVLARLGFPPKIVNLVRVFHENVTLEVDLDDDGNTIIIKYNIGVKQGDTLAPVLFLCYIQAVLETLFPKFEAAGIEKLMLRSMQPKRAANGGMAAGSLMVKPAVFHSSMCKAPSLPKCMVVHTGSITIVPPSAGPPHCAKPYCGPPRSARLATSKDSEPSCSEIEVIIRDFESGPGVFADDGAFAFGSRRDIELGARILYDHCVRWGMMPHTAGKTVAMYFGQPVVNLREFLPDEAIPPIKMGDGEAPVVEEFKYLGSMLSKNFDDSVTIMARIRLARIAFTKLQKAIFGTRRVALESKKIAYESLVLSLLLYGSECWVVSAENMRLLQRFHRKCIRIMCRVTRHHTRKHRISTEELEAKLGIHDIRHYAHSRVLRYLGHVFRMDADRTPSLLQRCWVVDGKQPSGKTKVLYDSAIQKLLGEVGLSLLDAANKSEWHNITRPEALAAQARAASRFPAQVAAQRPSAATKGAASSTSRAAAGASVTASATCKPESRRNLKPTKPAIEISDADRKRKILITVKCIMAFKKWREKGESFREDRYRCIEGRCLHQIMSAKTKVTKTKTALKQETYNLSDLKHDLHCGFVELGGSVSVSS